MLQKEIENLIDIDTDSGYIYCIYDKSTDLIGYVGLTKDPLTRWNGHRYDMGGSTTPIKFSSSFEYQVQGVKRTKSDWSKWMRAKGGVIAMRIIDVAHKEELGKLEVSHTERLVYEGHPICNKEPMRDEWIDVIENNWPIFKRWRQLFEMSKSMWPYLSPLSPIWTDPHAQLCASWDIYSGKWKTSYFKYDKQWFSMSGFDTPYEAHEAYLRIVRNGIPMKQVELPLFTDAS